MIAGVEKRGKLDVGGISSILTDVGRDITSDVGEGLGELGSQLKVRTREIGDRLSEKARRITSPLRSSRESEERWSAQSVVDDVESMYERIDSASTKLQSARATDTEAPGR